jgi:hypothetical protein
MGIRYEGRYPDADSALATKKWADDTSRSLAVDTAYVNGEISRVVQANNLQTTSYVDAQDNLLARLTDVQAADAACLAATARNNTVAGLDGSGMLISAQLPTTIVTDRIARSHTGTAAFTGSYTCTTSSVREKKLASVTIADPGFSYIPLPFGFVTGAAGGTPGLYPWNGNGICGQLTVCPPVGSGDTIYGLGGCTDSPNQGSYAVLPHGASGATPFTTPAVTGSLTLDLYGCCLQGSGYIFSATNLSFFVIVMPAL